ncbi:hypothetical protein FQN50_001172 [Emmonsiellopsis sp. PD_5]|nr:hypothetical protein FQN50_001172 [Emmonsiellopsis sp. PD_5]
MVQETLTVFTNTYGRNRGPRRQDKRKTNKKRMKAAGITQFEDRVKELNDFDRRTATLWAGPGFGSRNADGNVNAVTAPATTAAIQPCLPTFATYTTFGKIVILQGERTGSNHTY